MNKIHDAKIIKDILSPVIRIKKKLTDNIKRIIDNDLK